MLRNLEKPLIEDFNIKQMHKIPTTPQPKPTQILPPKKTTTTAPTKPTEK